MQTASSPSNSDEILDTPVSKDGFIIANVGDFVVDAAVNAGVAKSKSDARRTIKQGGLCLNNGKIVDEDQRLQGSDFIHGRLQLYSGVDVAQLEPLRTKTGV